MEAFLNSRKRLKKISKGELALTDNGLRRVLLLGLL
jgi:hypothetical protein